VKRLALAGLMLAAVAAALLLPRPRPQAARMLPRLALFITRGLAPESALVITDVGAPRLDAAVARIEHLPDAIVRGALLPGGDVLATADRTPARDHMFDAELLRVSPGRAPVVLCDRVDHAARPLVSPDGRAYIGRGRGTALTIEEIDAARGPVRVVWNGEAHHASPAALIGDELVIYVVEERGASLHAIDRATGRARTLTSLPPFARDFTVSGGALVYAGRDEQRSDLWVVERLDPQTGARTRLHRSTVQALAPHAWPGADVAISDGRGLLLAAGGRLFADDAAHVVRAAGAGFAAAWRYAPDARQPDVELIDTTTHAVTLLRAPDEATRLEIVGLLP